MNLTDLNKCLDGEEFENFTIENIFHYDEFEILEKSHPEHRLKYFVQSNLNPDFKLKCKETGKVFWIECKYVQSYVIDEYREIPVKNGQLARYKKIKQPTFYLYGTGLYAQTITRLFLIPLENMFENKIYESHLLKHEIQLKKIRNFNELLEITQSKK